jgi:hypothetical protein
MRYDEMDSANQAKFDRIAATLVAGAMFVGSIGMAIGVQAGTKAGTKGFDNKWQQGLPECEASFQLNCVTSPELLLENGLEERA